MMKLIRWFIGTLLLFFDSVTSPTPAERSAEEQTKLDQLTSKLVLYQFEACPFCIKVRRAIRKMNLKIALKDALDPAMEAELIKGGGQRQVPCLRTQEADGSFKWLYESGDIIEYLQRLVCL